MGLFRWRHCALGRGHQGFILAADDHVRSFPSGGRSVSGRHCLLRESRGSADPDHSPVEVRTWVRSEEHTSELQSLMRISYAVFCLKKKKRIGPHDITDTIQ